MIREISIKPVLNGFICKVGCQQVVFESVTNLVQNLDAYLRDPDVVEKEFVRDAVNKMPDQPQCMPTACDAGEAVNTIVNTVCGGPGESLGGGNPSVRETRITDSQCEARGPQPIERRTARESSRVTENRASDPSPSEGGNALGPRR